MVTRQKAMKRTTAKKPAAKKTATKKPAAKKATAKKAVRKTAAKKSAAKKPAAKKPATKKPVARKSAVKKAAAKTARGNASPGNVSMDEVLGQVVRLLARHGKTRFLFLADLEHRVYPPMRLGQCRVLRTDDGQPAAYASWAWVGDAVHERLARGDTALKPEEWNCGPHPWLVDVAAPPQALPQVMAELQRTVFKGEKVRTLFNPATS